MLFNIVFFLIDFVLYIGAVYIILSSGKLLKRFNKQITNNIN